MDPGASLFVTGGAPPTVVERFPSMTKHLGYFGGKTHGRLILEDGQREDVWFDRELWFDRDIDGRWLVGVTDQDRTGEEHTGAIVVKDANVSAFIELLGKLVADPDKFGDEPVLLGPAWDGHVPER
jgi:hypothetical protein